MPRIVRWLIDTFRFRRPRHFWDRLMVTNLLYLLLLFVGILSTIDLIFFDFRDAIKRSGEVRGGTMVFEYIFFVLFVIGNSYHQALIYLGIHELDARREAIRSRYAGYVGTWYEVALRFAIQTLLFLVAGKLIIPRLAPHAFALVLFGCFGLNVVWNVLAFRKCEERLHWLKPDSLVSYFISDGLACLMWGIVLLILFEPNLHGAFTVFVAFTGIYFGVILYRWLNNPKQLSSLLLREQSPMGFSEHNNGSGI